MCEAASCTISKRCTQTLTPPEWGRQSSGKKMRNFQLLGSWCKSQATTKAMHFTSNNQNEQIAWRSQKLSTEIVAKSVSSWSLTGIEWSQTQSSSDKSKKEGGTRHLNTKVVIWINDFQSGSCIQAPNSRTVIAQLRTSDESQTPPSPTGNPKDRTKTLNAKME